MEFSLISFLMRLLTFYSRKLCHWATNPCNWVQWDLNPYQGYSDAISLHASKLYRLSYVPIKRRFVYYSPTRSPDDEGAFLKRSNAEASSPVVPRTGFEPVWRNYQFRILTNYMTSTCCGREGGTRTHTVSRPGDFKSPVAAITPLPHIKRRLAAYVYTPHECRLKPRSLYNIYRKWKNANSIFLRAFLSFYPCFVGWSTPLPSGAFIPNPIGRRYIGGFRLLRVVRTRSFTFYIYYIIIFEEIQISSLQDTKITWL